MTKEIVRKHRKILGIGITSTSKSKLLRNIISRLVKKNNLSKFYIVTPNPEQLMMAQEDEIFKKILNEADISIADGIGIVAASKFLSLPRPKRIITRFVALLKQGFRVGISVLFDQKWLQSELELIKGRELFLELVIASNKRGWDIVFLGDKNKSAQKAATTLRKNYKKVKIHAFEGPNIDNDANPRSKKDRLIQGKVLDKINKIKPKLLFIGFGAPKQEKWLYRWFDKMDIGGAMVIGGTFEYISGVRKTSPGWIENLNLEWLWRLLTGNQKLKRISNATLSFPARIFLEKLIER